MASVAAVPSVIGRAVSWLSGTITVLINIYKQICNFMHMSIASLLGVFFFQPYERILSNA